jgi:hypothetical protein
LRKLKFIEGALPEGIKQDFDPYLFNGQVHRQLQAPQDWVSFHVLNPERKKNLASLHFHVHEAVAQSPYRAPFGSVEFSDTFTPQELFTFFQDVETALRRRAVRVIRIKNPPTVYRPKGSTLTEVLLLNLGYRVERAEINASLPVDTVGLEKKLAPWESRKLKQSQKGKLKVKKIPLARLEEVYHFIFACRQERTQRLSMTFADLRDTVRAMKKNFVLFAVFLEEELAAASIVIRVNRKIAYTFYTGHRRKFDSLSPVVLLTVELYRWCQEQGVAVLDLGTSALEDQPNFGLLDFKLHLGGIPSAKLTLVKDLL